MVRVNHACTVRPAYMLRCGTHRRPFVRGALGTVSAVLGTTCLGLVAFCMPDSYFQFGLFWAGCLGRCAQATNGTKHIGQSTCELVRNQLYVPGGGSAIRGPLCVRHEWLVISLPECEGGTVGAAPPGVEATAFNSGAQMLT
jgi:hypothetical protein